LIQFSASRDTRVLFQWAAVNIWTLCIRFKGGLEMASFGSHIIHHTL